MLWLHNGDTLTQDSTYSLIPDSDHVGSPSRLPAQLGSQARHIGHSFLESILLIPGENLTPNHQVNAMMLWWKTCKNETCWNFFLAMKNTWNWIDRVRCRQVFHWFILSSSKSRNWNWWYVTYLCIYVCNWCIYFIQIWLAVDICHMQYTTNPVHQIFQIRYCW